MSVGQNPRQLKLPEGTQLRLEEFRKRVWIVKLAEGILAAVFGLVISYIGVFVLDRFMDTSAALRTALLIAGASGPGLFLPLKWHRWVWRQRRLENVAKLLRHSFPRLSDQLLGVIELAHADSGEQRSERLVEAAMQQVDEVTRDRDFTGAVPNPKHRAWAWRTAVPVVLVVAALVAVTPAATNALARWLMPWSDTERYTFAQLNELPDEMVVPYAEPFNVKAELSKKTEWSPSDGSATYGNQEPIESPLDGSKYGFNVPPQKDAQPLNISIGDARKSIKVAPTTRPELTDMVAQIDLPDYLKRPDDQRKDVRGGAVTILRGSRATFEATASRELSQATVNGKTGQVKGDRIITKPVSVTESTEREFAWVDKLGLSAKEPFKLRIHARDDEAPTLSTQKLKNGQIVLEKEVISFEIDAFDDFGIAKIGLEWHGVEDPLRNPNPAKGGKVVAAGDPKRTAIEALGTFSARREKIKPQTLQVRAYALDYKPDREKVYSPTYTIHVLSAEEHAMYLTDEYRKWYRKAEEVYSHELQLHEANIDLRKLDPETLDRPETRRQIEAQASAENANARRLDALTKAGQDLVKEMTRNDQFNVKTLEDTAEMVKVLDDIANSRMPSVAKLLKEAANAPGSNKSPKSDQGQQGKPHDGQSQKSDGQKNDGQSSDGKPGQGEQGKGEPRPGDGKSDAKPGDGKEGKGGGKSDSQNSRPGEPKDGSSGDSKKKSAPNASENKNNQGGKGEQGDQKNPPPPVPSVNDTESGFNKLDDKPKPPSPPKPGRLTLPGTTLIGGGPEDENEPAECPVQEQLDEAIQVQADLLAEFAKVADALQKILGNLEGSTFVKRLKAASRRQIEIAGDLNSQLVGKFGQTKTQLDAKQKGQARQIGEREYYQSESIDTIQTDLESFFNRVHEGKYKTVLNEMQDAEVVSNLRKVGDSVQNNMSGRSIAQAEFWADSLDRWAEQLVGPG